jgi:hypothetical protein
MSTAPRFDVGDRVRVLTHPDRPWAVVTAWWPAETTGDTYGENVYAVSGFVTLQRESSLAAEGWLPLSLDALDAWRTAGQATVRRVGPGTVEVGGGPGIVWYPRAHLADFTLTIDWRLSSPHDDSGVLVRLPPLAPGASDAERAAAIAEGYEVQIDDRGVDPERGVVGSDRHRTGAIYGRAPALARASRPVGEWNTFEIELRGGVIRVRLNGVAVCTLAEGTAPRRRGHVGLQAHDRGSLVRFRNPQARPHAERLHARPRAA